MGRKKGKKSKSSAKPTPAGAHNSVNDVLSADGMSKILENLCATVRLANQLPQEKQLQLLKLTNREFAMNRKKASKQVCESMGHVTAGYGLSLELPTGKSNDLSDDDDDDDDGTASLSGLGVKDSLFDRVTQTTDEALDYFNRALDDARGIQDAVPAITGGLGHADAKWMGLLSARNPIITANCDTSNLNEQEMKWRPVALNIEKPQLHFPDYPIDNSSNPFIPPYLSEKTKQFFEVMRKEITSKDEASQERTEQPNKEEAREVCVDDSLLNQQLTRKWEKVHPYEEEIDLVAKRMSVSNFELIDVKDLTKVNFKKPFSYVDTEEDLKGVANLLRDVDELAVDLENHSVRSFQGFVCLMQLSTRDEDFIIDALALRGQIHKYLSPIFVDENIVKVFHGADSDMKWLQRDFGIYVVNMFDTGVAARYLGYPSASFFCLYSRFIGQTQKARDVFKRTKKKYQLADWRERPLSKNMLDYARDDTRYLLHLYDCVRTELHHKSLSQAAWKKSSMVARVRYMKPSSELRIARGLAAKHGLGFDPAQIQLLDRLFEWRDITARTEDESPDYVAPTKLLYKIVSWRDRVTTVEGLLKCAPRIDCIKNHAEALVLMICDALHEANDTVLKDKPLLDNEDEGQSKVQNSDDNTRKANTQTRPSIADKLAESLANSREKSVTFDVAPDDNDGEDDDGEDDDGEDGDGNSENEDDDDSDNDQEDNITPETANNLAISERVEMGVKAMYNENSNKSLSVDPSNFESHRNKPEVDESSDEEEEISASAPREEMSEIAEAPARPTVSFSSAPVRRKRKSALLGSDSEESSDGEGEEVIAPATQSGTIATSISPKKSQPLHDKELSGAAKVSYVAKPIESSERRECDSDGEVVGSVDEEAARMAAVSHLNQQLAEEMRDHVKKATDFSIEMEDEKDEVMVADQDQAVQKNMEVVDVEKTKSIFEMYGDKPPSQNAQKRKRESNKTVNRGEGIDLDSINRNNVVQPFDYRNSSRFGESGPQDGNNPPRVERFDPMRKLKTEWKHDRPKVKKRRVGRARSMSFRSKK